MRAAAIAGDHDTDEVLRAVRTQPAMAGAALVAQVSTREPYTFSDSGAARIAVVDFGCKRSILRRLQENGAAVDVFPHDVDADTIAGYDGVLLSPGPGDPAPLQAETRMLQDLHVQKHESVLEIGTGSGFMAALLAHRAAQVLSLEIDPALAARAAATLRQNGVANVEVRNADGAVPLPSGPSFDVIVLSGSVARIPQNLLGSLKVGGRLAAIVGEEPMMRAHFVTRSSESKWDTIQPWDTVAPRLLNFPEPSRFSF